MKDDDQSLLDTTAYRVNWLVERICALLLGIMVIVIWFEVVERYFLHLGMTWTEELSRYLMIWAALLAVSCGASTRSSEMIWLRKTGSTTNCFAALCKIKLMLFSSTNT